MSEVGTDPGVAEEVELTEAGAVRAEARKVAETADRIANGGTPEEADSERVVAGMIRQLADQIDRLAALLDVAP
ncbi:MAG: hypothetical protein QOE83_956 [Actinomycetota bacterium]|nr:hypothetical protein [Actinomycetota bacterium]